MIDCLDRDFLGWGFFMRIGNRQNYIPSIPMMLKYGYVQDEGLPSPISLYGLHIICVCVVCTTKQNGDLIGFYPEPPFLKVRSIVRGRR